MNIVSSHGFVKAQLFYSVGVTKAVYRKDKNGSYHVSLAGKAVVRCANKEQPLDNTYKISIVELGVTASVGSDGSWSYDASPVLVWANGKQVSDHLSISLLDKGSNVLDSASVPLSTDGTDGTSPVKVDISPAAYVYHQIGTESSFNANIIVQDGEKVMHPVNYTISLPESLPEGLSLLLVDSKLISFADSSTVIAHIKANSTINSVLTFTVKYKEQNYSCRLPITTVVDGATGDQGPIFYCAGVWSADKEYTRTKELCPYVLYEDSSSLTPEGTNYYMPTKIGTIAANGKAPSEDATNWKHVEKPELILAHMAVMDFASIGDAMFKGSYMFSKDGTPTNDDAYLNFDEKDPENVSKFRPNYYVNFKTGKMYAVKGNFSGTIDSSTINGGTINGSTFTSKSADGKSQTVIQGGQLKTSNGEFEGILKLSCSSHGNTGSANLFYLVPIDSDKDLTFPSDVDQPGKVIRFFNSGDFGKGTYTFHFHSFTTTKYKDGDLSSQTVIDDEIFYSPVRPQECIEVTCFEDVSKRVVKDGSITKRCYWKLTGRFDYFDFVRNEKSNIGSRYPRVICMGQMDYNNGSPVLSGKWWNSSYNIGSKITLTRVKEGQYKLSFASSDIPNGYTVMVTGIGTGTYKTGESIHTQTHNYYNTACIHEQSQEYIIIDIVGSSDSGQKLYDGNFNFVIFAPDWDYPLGA